ncbi:hypothetical protein RN001_000270 [Aquatica leii]|uniref:Secreted protein n=1 Tax=Aquatica leii TaxID=1421715 RepID=A0AAN7Q2T2_9COLE|nr:hypothetical protein RN001_000270 [Aquatica leii]
MFKVALALLVVVAVVDHVALGSDLEDEYLEHVAPVVGVGFSKRLSIGIRFNKPLITYEPHYEPYHVHIPHHVHSVHFVPEHRIAPIGFRKRVHFGIGF